jgi:hypothetical protein
MVVPCRGDSATLICTVFHMCTTHGLCQIVAIVLSNAQSCYWSCPAYLTTVLQQASTRRWGYVATIVGPPVSRTVTQPPQEGSECRKLRNYMCTRLHQPKRGTKSMTRLSSRDATDIDHTHNTHKKHTFTMTWITTVLNAHDMQRRRSHHTVHA